MLWTCYYDLPFVVGLLGILVAVHGFARQKNLAFLLLALLFVHPVISVVSWWVYAHNFGQTQIGPNMWTAPVRQVNLLGPVTTVVLLVATWLFARSTDKKSA